MTTAPTDYTELRKAAEAMGLTSPRRSAELFQAMAGIAKHHKTIIALLDAHATVVAERDALRERVSQLDGHLFDDEGPSTLEEWNS